MTQAAVREYINRRKAKRGTWKALGAELGVNFKQLQMIAAGTREPDANTLTRLGIIETVRKTYRFNHLRPDTETK